VWYYTRRESSLPPSIFDFGGRRGGRGGGPLDLDMFNMFDEWGSYAVGTVQYCAVGQSRHSTSCRLHFTHPSIQHNTSSARAHFTGVLYHNPGIARQPIQSNPAVRGRGWSRNHARSRFLYFLYYFAVYGAVSYSLTIVLWGYLSGKVFGSHLGQGDL